ncbi:hypothetical protein [Mesorhizobium sp. M0859]|uniref:hypothetical protein n=1 Tax=Mesorhizobium sp. M0859 TaxID=2957014 RepID=UPI00333A1FEC
MSTRETNKAILESILDGGHTIQDVLLMLADVCHEKADWVRSPESVGLPDERYAKRWERCAAKIERAAVKIVDPR